MVPLNCRATIGVIGNGDHNLVNIGKAGRKRHMGFTRTRVFRKSSNIFTIITELSGRSKYLTEDMVGHKLGEFVATRTYRGHGKDEKKSGVR